jgi:formylglycine-generating enzyme required for sulfatase activity
MSTTGAIPLCVTGEGALDLSGNVKEWTNDPRGTTASGNPIYVIRGGSYDSPRLGLSCQTDLSRATADSLLDTLGFRCCSSSAP